MPEAAAIECRDWRAADADLVVPLIQTEVQAWRRTLAWDVSEAWAVVEPARQAGQLPGLIAHGRGGRVTGWTAYLHHQGHLQVMALVADEPAVTSALVDGVLASPEAHRSDCILFSVRDQAPGLPALLEARGGVVDRHQYLLRDLDEDPRPAVPVQRWHECDLAMARLCEEAYRESPGVRAFAPGGTPAEWRHYIGTLVRGNGCGWFLPELSRVVPLQPSAGPTEGLDAALMLTDLGGGVAHIAQLAVRPAARRRGLARMLVDAASADAARFFTRVTLMVSGENQPALRLYQAAGFRPHAPFIVARLAHHLT